MLQNFARMDELHHLFMHDIRRDTFSTLSRGVDGDWFVYYTINGSYVISYGRRNNKQNIICIYIILQCTSAHQTPFETKEKVRTDFLIMINDMYNKYAYSINSWNLNCNFINPVILKFPRKTYESRHKYYYWPHSRYLIAHCLPLYIYMNYRNSNTLYLRNSNTTQFYYKVLLYISDLILCYIKI